MAIQKVNLGSNTTGQGGDTLRSAMSKINENFSNADNAASKEVGNAEGRVPSMSRSFGLGSLGYMGAMLSINNIDTDKLALDPLSHLDYKGLPTGSYYFQSNCTGKVSNKFVQHWAYAGGNTRGFRLVNQFYTDKYYFQCSNSDGSDWNDLVEIYHTKSNVIYNTTTASSPNVHVTSAGELQRSTSSERYKKNIQGLIFTDEMYAEFKQLVPIFYQSTAETDNPNWWYQSFNADEVGKAHPSLVGWEDTETVLDEETGEYVERKLEKRRAIGLNLNGIVAVMQAGNLYQAKKIEELEARLEALEEMVLKG